VRRNEDEMSDEVGEEIFNIQQSMFNSQVRFGYSLVAKQKIPALLQGLSVELFA
jgi:hypothetical protein